MIFSNAGLGVSAAAASRLDQVMLEAGVLKNSAKDVNDELNATCVGVSFEEGHRLGVPPGRCLAMFVSFLHLVAARKQSPKAVHGLLSTLQWYDLLRRQKLSVYETVYAFVQHVQDVPQRIPARVLQELLISLLLSIFWVADLSRPFLPLICASDASTEFGFGAAVAKVPVNVVRRIARLAEKQGDYVVLDGGTAYEELKSRLGKAHHLDLPLGSFVQVFSIRKRHSAHINILETEAFVLLLRWILRSRKRHCARVVVLVDSMVLQGAAAKGRSSSVLNKLLRKAAALEMAGDLLVHLVLVPSQENPSDDPSRGVRRHRPPHVNALMVLLAPISA